LNCHAGPRFRSASSAACPLYRFLVGRDGPAEPELQRGRLLGFDQRMARGEVVHLDQQQSRLDARDVERQHARRRDAVRRAGFDQGIQSGTACDASTQTSNPKFPV